jgi:hypothetical protein
MKEFDQKILDTAFWTIGIAGAMVTLLVGFSWFANLKLYDRDKAALTQELKSSLQQELSKATQTLKAESTKRSEQIAETARSAGEAAAGELKEEMEASVAKLTRQIADLRVDMLETEGRRWMADAVYSNATRAYMLMLSLAVAQKADWRISRALGFLNDALDKVIKESKSRPDVELARQLVELLDSLPASFALEVTSLKAKLTTARG